MTDSISKRVQLLLRMNVLFHKSVTVTFYNGKLVYSPVHISSDEVFSMILKNPSIVKKKMIPHMKAFGLFNKMKQKKNIFF